MATARETEAVVGLFDVLPKRSVANVLSFTSPPDACRFSSISTTFRSAADSDVWDRFLPPEWQSIISRSAHSSFLPFSSKKELYLRLYDHPLLIDDGEKLFLGEKEWEEKLHAIPKGAGDYLDGYSLGIGDGLLYRRFPEVAERISVCWLEIRGKISTSILSPATLYATYLGTCEVAVGLVGAEVHTRTVYLDTERERRMPSQIVPRQGIGHFNGGRFFGFKAPQPHEIVDCQHPKERGDGWLEIELGEFFNGEENGELEMSVLELKGGNWKGGLIIQGIEIRAKESK